MFGLTFANLCHKSKILEDLNLFSAIEKQHLIIQR